MAARDAAGRAEPSSRARPGRCCASSTINPHDGLAPPLLPQERLSAAAGAVGLVSDIAPELAARARGRAA